MAGRKPAGGRTRIDGESWAALCRLLAWRFRPWTRIASPRDGLSEASEPSPRGDRTWLLLLGAVDEEPERLLPVLLELVAREAVPPWGVLVFVPRVLSRRLRFDFLERAASLGVRETHLWDADDVQERLGFPENDDLLFGFAGESRGAERAALAARLASRLRIKEALIRAIGQVGERFARPVLLRDASAAGYPFPDDVPGFDTRPPWLYLECVGHMLPEHIAFLLREEFAFADETRETWGASPEIDLAGLRLPAVAYRTRAAEGSPLMAQLRLLESVDRSLPVSLRARHKTFAFLHYDDILAVDEHGDEHHPGPQILILFRDGRPPWRRLRPRLDLFAGGRAEILAVERMRRVDYPAAPAPSAADSGGSPRDEEILGAGPVVSYPGRSAGFAPDYPTADLSGAAGPVFRHPSA